MMDRSAIFEKLNEIFQDVFDDDSLTVCDETTADDVDGWDSLTHITLLATVEDEFDIKFNMKDVIGLKNVGEMVTLIQNQI